MNKTDEKRLDHKIRTELNGLTTKLWESATDVNDRESLGHFMAKVQKDIFTAMDDAPTGGPNSDVLHRLGKEIQLAFYKDVSFNLFKNKTDFQVAISSARIIAESMDELVKAICHE